MNSARHLPTAKRKKNSSRVFIFAVRPPDGFSLLKIRSCFTFNHRGNSSQNYSLIGNLRKISAKDFFLLPRCYLPPFSIISRNIKNVFFPFCFKRLKNTTKTLHSLSDEKAFLQRIALLWNQYLKHRRKTGFSDKRGGLFGNAPLVFGVKVPSAPRSFR